MPIKGDILIVIIAVIFAVSYPNQICKWFNGWFDDLAADDDIDDKNNSKED